MVSQLTAFMEKFSYVRSLPWSGRSGWSPEWGSGRTGCCPTASAGLREEDESWWCRRSIVAWSVQTLLVSLRWYLEGSTVRPFPGFENFVPAVAYHFCLTCNILGLYLGCVTRF